MNSLKSKTLNGIIWSFIDSFGSYLLKFIFSVFIARALSPEDYGTMGMLVIFLSISQLLTEGGFAMALIQKKNVTEKDKSTIFWFNLSVSLLLYLVLFLTSETIADYFKTPILAIITKITALNIIISSLNIVHLSVLAKAINFKRQALINFLSVIISGAIGIILAYNDYHVYALVFQTITSSIITTIFLWYNSKWIPQFRFSIKSIKYLFKYGNKIFIQGITDVIFTKSYYPLIAKLYSASELGFYSNASRFSDVFIRQTSVSITKVLFPTFSAIQDNKVATLNYYIKTFSIMVFLFFFSTSVLIVSISPLIHLFLTDKWAPSIIYMKILFLEGFFFPFFLLNQNLLCAVNHVGLALKIDLIKKVLTFISLFFIMNIGIKGLLITQVIITLTFACISTFFVFNLLNIKLKEIIKPLTQTALVVAACFLLDSFLFNHIMHHLKVTLVLKFLCYTSLFLIASKLFSWHSFKLITQMIKETKS